MNHLIELKVGELFVGAGGLSLGFILADHAKVRFRPIFAIDNDTNSLNSYKFNMHWLHRYQPDMLPRIPGVFKRNVEDLKTTAVLRLLKLKTGDLDLLLGGPPCQGFSSANRRGQQASKADRNKLINVFLDRLDEFSPKMFLIENVQGVKWTEPTQDMYIDPIQDGLFPDIKTEPTNVREFLIQKASHCYYIWHGVLNAVEFGVPQQRMRFFMFGVRKDLVPTQEVINLTPYLNQLKSTERISVKRAIGDLPELGNGQSWSDVNYHPGDDEYVKKMRRFLTNGDLYDHSTTLHADYVIERYKQIPEGGNWKTIKEQMSNYSFVDNTHSNIYRRLSNDAPAITISHYRKSMIIHPSQHRGLSFREACRLQSFPDWFRFQGPKVPPLMATAVANAIGELWLNLCSSKETTSASQDVPLANHLLESMR
jgi:DNA-cytosine methyltransferase